MLEWFTARLYSRVWPWMVRIHGQLDLELETFDQYIIRSSKQSRASFFRITRGCSWRWHLSSRVDTFKLWKWRTCTSFSNLSITSPTLQLILQPFCCFTYITAHSPTIPLLHLRHRSFSNPSFASPASQALHLISPGELPMLSSSIYLHIISWKSILYSNILLPASKVGQRWGIRITLCRTDKKKILTVHGTVPYKILWGAASLGRTVLSITVKGWSWKCP